MSHFNNSPYLAFTKIYSEYEWLPWKFDKVHNGFWDDMKNQRNFMDWVGKQLNYKNKEDWYQITNEAKKFKLKF